MRQSDQCFSVDQVYGKNIKIIMNKGTGRKYPSTREILQDYTG